MFAELFGTYYGLDWVSMALGFSGAWLVGDRRAIGFLLTAGSVALAIVVAVIADQYGFIAANVVSLVICLRNWRRWRSDDAADEPGSASCP